MCIERSKFVTLIFEAKKTQVIMFYMMRLLFISILNKKVKTCMYIFFLCVRNVVEINSFLVYMDFFLH